MIHSSYFWTQITAMTGEAADNKNKKMTLKNINVIDDGGEQTTDQYGVFKASEEHLKRLKFGQKASLVIIY